MKKLLLIFSILLSFVCNAQYIGRGGVYFEIPDAPTFTSPTHITPHGIYQCCGGGIYTPPFSTGGDYIADSTFTQGMSLKQWQGDATHIYRIKNGPYALFGSLGGLQPGIGQTNFGNYNYFYGASWADPMVVRGERGWGGYGASATGTNYVVQNVVAKSTTASGFQINGNGVLFGVGNFYNSFTQTFCRSFDSGQEAILYAGKTSPGGAYFNTVTVTNCFGFNASRETLQISGANNFQVTHVTGVRNGQGGITGQTNNFQLDDSNGLLRYFIMDGAPVGFNIFCHGISIKDGYISWTTAPGFIGWSTNPALYFAGSPRLNNDSIIFDGVLFKNKGALYTYAVEIAERVANIIFRNCTFEGVTTIYLDTRGPHTNTITGNIGDHGNVLASIIEPVYYSLDPNNYQYQGLIPPYSPYYKLHYGYRTP